jgi:hypothetical protein
VSLSREKAVEVMDYLTERNVVCEMSAYPGRKPAPDIEKQPPHYYVETHAWAEITPGHGFDIISEVARHYGVRWRIFVLDGTTGPKGKLCVQFL